MKALDMLQFWSEISLFFLSFLRRSIFYKQNLVKNFICLRRKFSKLRCIIQDGFHFGNVILLENDYGIIFISLWLTTCLFLIRSFKTLCFILHKFLSFVLFASL